MLEGGLHARTCVEVWHACWQICRYILERVVCWGCWAESWVDDYICSGWAGGGGAGDWKCQGWCITWYGAC